MIPFKLPSIPIAMSQHECDRAEAKSFDEAFTKSYNDNRELQNVECNQFLPINY